MKTKQLSEEIAVVILLIIPLFVVMFTSASKSGCDQFIRHWISYACGATDTLNTLITTIVISINITITTITTIASEGIRHRQIHNQTIHLCMRFHVPKQSLTIFRGAPMDSLDVRSEKQRPRSTAIMTQSSEIKLLWVKESMMRHSTAPTSCHT